MSEVLGNGNEAAEAAKAAAELAAKKAAEDERLAHISDGCQDCTDV